MDKLEVSFFGFIVKAEGVRAVLCAVAVVVILLIGAHFLR